MSTNLHRYEASRDRLLDVLRMSAPDEEDGGSNRSLLEAWRTSRDDATIHLRLVEPFRSGPYTFLMAHLEKGAVRVTSIPEDVTIQCLAGRFHVTDEAGHTCLVVASGSSSGLGAGAVHIRAHETYTYEALEEVYNIMKVSRETTT